jgi:hypothetical protein
MRSGSLAAALRDSREALGSLQGELDELLRSLRSAEGAPSTAAADRLRSATRAAAAAFASLGGLGDR